MSYSLSQLGDAAELPAKLEEAFATNYPEPAPGVEEQVKSSLDFVEKFLVDKEGSYSASLSGHVQQAETDRSSVAVNVSAAG